MLIAYVNFSIARLSSARVVGAPPYSSIFNIVSGTPYADSSALTPLAVPFVFSSKGRLFRIRFHVCFSISSEDLLIALHLQTHPERVILLRI